MKKLLILLTFAFWITTATAQKQYQNPISNNQFEVVDDKIVILYDLAKPKNKKNYYNIQLEISLDGDLLNVESITGDVGEKIRAGKGKKIVWDVLKDVSSLDGDLQIDILVDTYAPVQNKIAPVVKWQPPKPTSPPPSFWQKHKTGIILGIIGIIGLTIGSTQYNSAKSDYDIYKNNTNELAFQTAYGLSRSEAFDNANGKRRRAAITNWGSAFTLGISTALFLKKRKK